MTQRYEQDRQLMAARHRLHSAEHQQPDGTVRGCPCDFKPGLFRKRHPFDCGRTRCMVCHAGKVMGVPSWRDRLQRLAVREQLREVLDDAFITHELVSATEFPA